MLAGERDGGGGLLTGGRLPFVYRTHEAPDDEKIRSFGNLYSTTSAIRCISARGEVRPKEIQKLLARVEGRPEEPMIARLALRSMKQARYTAENDRAFRTCGCVLYAFHVPNPQVSGSADPPDHQGDICGDG